jgi:hypothetical protein
MRAASATQQQGQLDPVKTGEAVPAVLLALLTRMADALDDMRRQLKTVVMNSSTGKLAVTIEEAEQLLDCGRTKVFNLLKTGVLVAAEKHGRARMVTSDSIHAALGASAPKKKRAPPLRGARGWRPIDRRRLKT